MVVLTSDVVYNRLQDIKNPTQEAIETMSLWIMHYKDKASIDLIVDGWLNCFKTAGTDSKRIALFYVMNDVVQKAKMKHADTIIPAFQPAVLTAVGIGRKQEKVKGVMKRCIQIFKSRNVFSTASTTAMENLLDEGYDAEDQALEVDADDLYKKITNFVGARNVIADMMKYVTEGDFDYKEKCRSGMKDREEGAHILQEVHEAIDTMVQVRHSMEDQKKRMMALSETLELAKRVFLHQKREVLVVEEAYVNFRDGIKAVHTDLVEMEKKGVYPGIFSPNDEDIYNSRGMSQGWGDNRNQVDMEIDEDERPQAPMMKPALQALVGISSQPSLQSRIMQLGLKKIADGDEDMFQQNAGNAEVAAAIPSTFQGRPPALGANQFSIPPPAIPPPSVVDPRIRKDSEGGPSQYALALQQHGLPPPTQHKPMPVATPAAVQPAIYQSQFESRDPRFAAMQQQQPPPPRPAQLAQAPTAYQAQFEQRDPRIMHQATTAPVQQNYQNSYEAQKPSIISPQPHAGSYQGRFEPPPISPQVMAQQPQYHQPTGGFNRPPPSQQPPQQQQQPHQSHGFSDYNNGGDRRDDRYDRRDDRGRGSYHDNSRYDDRRKSAPYGNPRGGGGGERWRNGGGGGGAYNDRNRHDNRDNWRGGNSRGGGYNRY
ncbi:CRE-CIDS-2 protein [Caenorhabditis remanei]|uniref:CRE-CIDS-2 protein n=1 Tax=Caenorhabditis remanei TaxID=31234 RepID=E3LVM3_CAERE|nr:CRE-CIDS-2 protein [Caenorhabditis remanei]